MTSLKSSLNIWHLLLLLPILAVKADADLKEPPCNYWESVTLEGADKFPNGSYLLDGIILPANETWTYNYSMVVRNVEVNTSPHVRGCICKFRACISICCTNGDEYVPNECKETKYRINPFMDLTTEQGKTFVANISTQFINQYRRPCEDLFCFKDNFNFTLLENGSMYAYYDDGTRILSKDEYCLSPALVTTSGFRYYPWACNLKNKSDEEITRKGVVMIASVPFMLLTILAYLLSARESLKVKSTCFYLLTLSLAFSTLGYIILVRNIEQTTCTILGYTTYFAFIASYSWLAVTSFELYRCFSNRSDKGTPGKTLVFYSLFGWGFPIFLLGLALFAQHQNWDDIYKPNIGGKIYCFFENKGYNMIIYYYGPSIALISFNVLMFVLTIIMKIKTAIKVPLIYENGFRQKLKKYLRRGEIFARLFLITGVAWIFEILSYFFPESTVFKTLFYLVAFQGYFILFAVICKNKIRVELKKRFNKLFHREKSELFLTSFTK